MALSSMIDGITLTYSLLAALALYVIGVPLYRLTLHPLANIPGPKVAAVTWLYQTYYSYKDGKSQFYKEIEKLHKQYGPVVRITPDEVSLYDPANYDKIYNYHNAYIRDAIFYAPFKAPSSTFTTLHNDLYRARRADLSPLFSRKSILSIESLLQDKVTKLFARLDADLQSGESEGCNLHAGFRSLGLDVITEYLYDRCDDLLDTPDLGAQRLKTTGFVVMWLFMQVPWYQDFMVMLPRWAAPKPVQNLFNYHDLVRAMIEGIKARADAAKKAPQVQTRPSVIYDLLMQDDTAEQVAISTDRLMDESLAIVAAASDTTGNTMTVITYEVLKNAKVHARLKAELKEAFPDSEKVPSLLELEKLPYLTACIKEGLRTAQAVVSRLPRTVPEPGAEFNGYTIPAGMTVSMSSWSMHRNPDIFHDPLTYNPDRWLDPEDAQHLEKFLVAFSKGSRQCLGIPLAYAQLYVTIGRLFHRAGGLRNLNMTDADLELNDYLSSYQTAGSNKLHVVAA